MFGIPLWVWVVGVIVIVVLYFIRRKGEIENYIGLPEINKYWQPVSDVSPEPPQPVYRPPEPPRRRTWKHEEECRRVFEEIFGREFPSCRPEILRNPFTNRKLEFDGYCESLKLAFEYNGKQHVDGEGQTTQGFFDQVRRDLIKVRLADSAGVHLITIPHTVPMAEIYDYIYERLPESVHRFIVRV